MTALAARRGGILIVDDQEPNVRLLERILEQGGYPIIHSTTDARTVEALVAEHRPDLLLLDLHMPHIDGHALLELLAPYREQQGFLPVLVLTADVEPAARHRALDLGATDFVTKPFDASEVLVRCRNLLETRRLYRRLASHNDLLAGELLVRRGELKDARSSRELVLTTLTSLHAGATTEERARSLVEELSQATQFEAATILAFDPDGSATPLAIAGTTLFDGAVGSPLPAAVMGRLHERLSSGAQTTPVAVDFATLVPSAAEGSMRSAWLAPITEQNRLVGALLTVSRDAPGTDVLATTLPLATEFGAIARALVGPGLAERFAMASARQEIQAILDGRAFWPVFQPVRDIRAGGLIGLEALTRFMDGTRPDLRFADAHRVGLGVRLEEATLIAAFTAAEDLPNSAWLSVNASPELLLASGRVARALAGSRRIVVIEITEHVAISDYQALRDALKALGSNVRIAIDDAGAGFASFRHVLELEPDFVKLDADLVRGIDLDPSRQALVVGMRYFASKTGCTLIAEGIETEQERSMLDSLGIQFGQGYLLGRPARSSELAAGVLA